jgi:hypothetical protein
LIEHPTITLEYLAEIDDATARLLPRAAGIALQEGRRRG